MVYKNVTGLAINYLQLAQDPRRSLLDSDHVLGHLGTGRQGQAIRGRSLVSVLQSVPGLDRLLKGNTFEQDRMSSAPGAQHWKRWRLGK